MKKQEIKAFVALVVIGGAALWYLNTPGMQGVSTDTNPIVAQNNQQKPGTGGTPGAGAQGAQGLKSYSNPAFGFSFQYPASVSLETSGFGAGGFKAQGAIGVVAVYTRMDTVVNRLTVSMSAEPSDVGECTTTASNTKPVTINGAYFTTYTTHETKDAQVIDSTVYRIKRDKNCYELREVITSTIEAKLTAAQVQQQKANSAATSALINSIVQTFRFTN